VQLTSFDFDLPPGQIAQYPVAQRRDARLLVACGKDGGQDDARISDLPSLIEAGDLVVLNNTRVIPARLHGRKTTGGVVEILIERIISDHHALVQVRSSRPPRIGTKIVLEPHGDLTISGRSDRFFVVESEPSLEDLLEEVGHVPLPPYISRTDEYLDAERYQTVYASKPGAVAAPTAGLHLDREMLGELIAKGAELAYVTLHVGAGTFQPIRTANIASNKLHSERVEVKDDVCRAINRTKARGGRVVAVGTTTVRALETAGDKEGQINAFSGETRLFIRPGYKFGMVDALLTNFHLPRSTLLMLVCAFGGSTRVMSVYDHAIKSGYRFFSYGDAMWIERNHEI